MNDNTNDDRICKNCQYFMQELPPFDSRGLCLFLDENSNLEVPFWVFYSDENTVNTYSKDCAAFKRKENKNGR